MVFIIATVAWMALYQYACDIILSMFVTIFISTHPFMRFMGLVLYYTEWELDETRYGGEKVGLIKVRLYRPWDAEAFRAALPKSCTDVVVLDRTREDGALHGQPLYLDVSATLQRAGDTRNVVGGQYGLASKEFTPKHALACFQNVGAAEQKVSLQQC